MPQSAHRRCLVTQSLRKLLAMLYDKSLSCFQEFILVERVQVKVMSNLPLLTRIRNLNMAPRVMCIRHDGCTPGMLCP